MNNELTNSEITPKVLEALSNSPRVPKDMWNAGLPSVMATNKWGKPCLKSAPHVSVGVRQTIKNGGLAEEIVVTILGVETFPIKEQLKSAGFRWNGEFWAMTDVSVVDLPAVVDNTLEITGAVGVVVGSWSRDRDTMKAVRDFNRK